MTETVSLPLESSFRSRHVLVVINCWRKNDENHVRRGAERSHWGLFWQDSITESFVCCWFFIMTLFSCEDETFRMMIKSTATESLNIMFKALWCPRCLTLTLCLGRWTDTPPAFRPCHLSTVRYRKRQKMLQTPQTVWVISSSLQHVNQTGTASAKLHLTRPYTRIIFLICSKVLSRLI